MRKFLVFLALAAAAFGQSMLEGGALAAGTAIGTAGGKMVSDGINKNLKKSANVLESAAKTGAKGTSAKETGSVPAAPLLRVGAGVPKVERNNVPPPPPKRAAAKPAKPRPIEVPMVMSAVIPAEPPAFQVNVDLSSVQNGMARESVLALGKPSARITMYEDGHVLEIYQYRNQSLASGTVRLRDGAVWAVEARP